MRNQLETAYKLTWTIETYREFGSELGFNFDDADFERALNNERLLGTKRYIPSAAAEITLPIPPGVLVNCHLEPAAEETVLVMHVPTFDGRTWYLPQITRTRQGTDHFEETFLPA